MLRSATRHDLEIAASWVTTARECELWAGRRVRFPIDLDALMETMAFATTGALVLEVDARIVALGQIVVKSGGRAHLARLIVAPEHRGKHLGTRLVSLLLERARKSGHRMASLNVDPGNATAIALYSKLGFADAPRPDDEPDPYGSRYMERSL